MEFDAGGLTVLAAVVIGWALGRVPFAPRSTRRRRQLEQEWENLFSYDGQKQEEMK